MRDEKTKPKAKRWNHAAMARSWNVPEPVVRRLYEAVQIAKRQKLGGGHYADFIERHLGRKLRGAEYSIAARAKEHLAYDPPPGYGGPKPRGVAAEPSRWQDDRLIHEASRLARRACDHVRTVLDSKEWKHDRFFDARGLSALESAAEDFHFAAEAAEAGGRRIWAGTLREKSRIAERIASDKFSSEDVKGLEFYEAC